MSCTQSTACASARVLATEPGRVLLDVVRQNACSACAEQGHCRSESTPGHGQKIWLATQERFSPGESVTVSLPDTAVWRAALLVYGLPLAGFLAGLLVSAGRSDRMALVAALLGLVAGYFAARYAAHRLAPIPELALQRTKETA